MLTFGLGGARWSFRILGDEIRETSAARQTHAPGGAGLGLHGQHCHSGRGVATGSHSALTRGLGGMAKQAAGAGGPGWTAGGRRAGGSGSASWTASSGNTLCAEAVQDSPLGLRQSSHSHTARCRAAPDSWPSRNASRSQAIVSRDGKRRALPALPPFYTGHRPCVDCVRSLGKSH